MSLCWSLPLYTFFFFVFLEMLSKLWHESISLCWGCVVVLTRYASCCAIEVWNDVDMLQNHVMCVLVLYGCGWVFFHIFFSILIGCNTWNTYSGKSPSTRHIYCFCTWRFRIWCSIWRAFFGLRPNSKRPDVRRSKRWMVRKFFKLNSFAKMNTTVLWRYRPHGCTWYGFNETKNPTHTQTPSKRKRERKKIEKERKKRKRKWKRKMVLILVLSVSVQCVFI